MRYWYDTEFKEDGRTIELISIGIVAEDGREYYAVNDDADWPRIRQDEWLMANVYPTLGGPDDYKFKDLIAAEVLDFLTVDGKPDLWAWYGAYDHVVLCQIWGRMIDLPKGIPMFTRDLRNFTDRWTKLPKQDKGLHNALEDARHLKKRFDYLFPDPELVPRG